MILRKRACLCLQTIQCLQDYRFACEISVYLHTYMTSEICFQIRLWDDPRDLLLCTSIPSIQGVVLMVLRFISNNQALAQTLQLHRLPR